MTQPYLRLSALEPLERLRVRPRAAYAGTITEPGALVSDGKSIFVFDDVPEERRPLAEEVAARPAGPERRRVSQDEAAQVFAAMERGASRRAHVLGQMEKPQWIHAGGLDRVAVLRYGRGGSTGYVLLDAHRLLLLSHLTGSDEIRCEGPSRRVLLRRAGRPVAGMTALPVVPRVEP